MRTFDASLSNGFLGVALIVPPAGFIFLVQLWANGLERGELGPGGILFLVAVAQLIPVGALLWMLLSKAAYTVTPEKLVVHRVMFDREFSLAHLAAPPKLDRGVITLRLPKRLRLRVEEPETFLEILRAAPAPGTV